MTKIRAGVVSYLNTKPFLYGIDHSEVKNDLLLTVDHPASIGLRLQRDELDVALVPVRVIPLLADSHLISNYAITCDGEVGSVVICSQVPLPHADRLFIDYQSRTSAALTQILVKEYWKINIRQVQASPGYEKQIMGKYAGLFIGDRALKFKEMYDYVYDLGEAWKQFTGRPFVFACWASNKPLPNSFIESFNQALKFGVDHIQDVIAEQQPNYPGVNVQHYLTQNIQFQLTQARNEAMEFFLQKVAKEQEVGS